MCTGAKTMKRAPQMAHFLQIHCYLQSICICGPQAAFFFLLFFYLSGRFCLHNLPRHPIMLTVNNLPKPPSGMSQNRSTPTWHGLCKCRSWTSHHIGVRLQLNVNITPPTPTPTPCPACASWRNMNTARPHTTLTVAFMACASWRHMNTAPPTPPHEYRSIHGVCITSVCKLKEHEHSPAPHQPMSTVALMACASWRNMNTAPPHTTPLIP